MLILALLGLNLNALVAREVKNINFDWWFNLGDVKNGEGTNTDYKAWRLLDVPHDWSIECEYKLNVPGHRANAYLPSGIGWYKKEIVMPDNWKDKLVFIEFDGIYMNSTVWINGEKVGFRPNGYLSLNYELTPYLKSGKNVISVKVDNSLQPSARWYSGNGIYRDVNLIIKDKVYVEKDGTFVLTPQVSPQSASVKVEAAVINTLPKDANAKISSVILDPNGKEVARNTKAITLKQGENLTEDNLTVSTPKLWSPESPLVYVMKTIVEIDGKETDTYTTNFGIRKLDFDTKAGFKLNDKVTKLKGVCIHQNTSPMGIALNSDTWHKRLVMLKEMGCNAIRTTHYPFSPEFYNMCDTMGFMVMDEPWDGWFQWKGNGKARHDYGYYFLDWWEKDLTDFIKRDRNHPSVIMWSMGNEVWQYDKHQYLQMLINNKFHKLDPSRPTTQAWALDTYLDIAGFNANGEGKFDLAEFHKDQPNKLAVGTEIPHTRQTRGVYRTKTSYMPWDKPDNSGHATSAANLDQLYSLPDLTDQEVFTGVDLRYASSYDNHTRKISCRDQWRQTRDNFFFIGEFRWTAFDYLGESWAWPARTNNYGVIDMADFPKDSYYLYQSMWSDKPMVHLLPHWTHPGKEGVEIPVVVYTNGDQAELLFNGKSLGRKTMDKDVLQIMWLVPYKTGTLTAISYKDGKETARKSVSTASKASTVKLSTNKTSIKANRHDLVYITADIVDSKGELVPHANNLVNFEVTGPYKLIGVENGDILDMNSNKQLSTKAFMGKTLLVLQSTDKPGTLSITAKSDGLKSSKVVVKTN